jgi:glutathione S-transferase
MRKIWGRTTSLNVQKVLWCLAEMGMAEGLDFERSDAGLAYGVVNTPEYRRLNPNGLVPTLIEDDFVLWESNSIVRYLAGVHGAGSLMPADARERADAERWMDWMVGTFWPLLRPVFVGLTRTAPAQRDMAAMAAGYAAASRALEVLEQSLEERDYVAGARFTVGDIPLGVSVVRWLRLGDAFAADLGPRPALPRVEAWFARVSSRPAYRQAQVGTG